MYILDLSLKNTIIYALLVLNCSIFGSSFSNPVAYKINSTTNPDTKLLRFIQIYQRTNQIRSHHNVILTDEPSPYSPEKPKFKSPTKIPFQFRILKPTINKGIPFGFKRNHAKKFPKWLQKLIGSDINVTTENDGLRHSINRRRAIPVASKIEKNGTSNVLTADKQWLPILQQKLESNRRFVELATNDPKDVKEEVVLIDTDDDYTEYRLKRQVHFHEM